MAQSQDRYTPPLHYSEPPYPMELPTADAFFYCLL
jgi:hypothetical protein